jgi:hypothetical protein
MESGLDLTDIDRLAALFVLIVAKAQTTQPRSRLNRNQRCCACRRRRPKGSPPAGVAELTEIANGPDAVAVQRHL